MEQEQVEKGQAEKRPDNKEQAILEQITEAMRECAQIMLQADHDHAGVDEKAGKANLVTKYDKMVQEAIREKLMNILPEAVFVGEEEDIHASIKEGLAFIVDPIDGTNNFIKDYRCSAISVGVTKNGEAYMGAVYNPYLDEMFTAIAGQGAFLNGKAIHVSEEPLEHGIVIFGTSPYYEDLAEQSFRLAYEYFQKAMDVRRSGSAALDLCNVAAGRAELFFELRLSPWDFAAGSLIVTEAGGKVTQIDGSPVDLSRPCPVLATNGR